MFLEGGEGCWEQKMIGFVITWVLEKAFRAKKHWFCNFLKVENRAGSEKQLVL